MAKVNDGVCSLAELFLYRLIESHDVERCSIQDSPFTYFCFVSSFSCSANSDTLLCEDGRLSAEFLLLELERTAKALTFGAVILASSGACCVTTGDVTIVKNRLLSSHDVAFDALDVDKVDGEIDIFSIRTSIWNLP